MASFFRKKAQVLGPQGGHTRVCCHCPGVWGLGPISPPPGPRAAEGSRGRGEVELLEGPRASDPAKLLCWTVSSGHALHGPVGVDSEPLGLFPSWPRTWVLHGRSAPAFPGHILSYGGCWVRQHPVPQGVTRPVPGLWA